MLVLVQALLGRVSPTEAKDKVETLREVPEVALPVVEFPDPPAVTVPVVELLLVLLDEVTAAPVPPPQLHTPAAPAQGSLFEQPPEPLASRRQ